MLVFIFVIRCVCFSENDFNSSIILSDATTKHYDMALEMYHNYKKCKLFPDDNKNDSQVHAGSFIQLIWYFLYVLSTFIDIWQRIVIDFCLASLSHSAHGLVFNG